MIKTAFVYTNQRFKTGPTAAIAIAQKEESVATILNDWQNPISELKVAIEEVEQQTKINYWYVAQESIKLTVDEVCKGAYVRLEKLDLEVLTQKFYDLLEKESIVAGEWRFWQQLLTAVGSAQYSPRWIACMGALVNSHRSYIVDPAQSRPYKGAPTVFDGEPSKKTDYGNNPPGHRRRGNDIF